jgi:hypothetical protein
MNKKPIDRKREAKEIDQNYEAFRQHEPELLNDRRGQHALLKNRAIIAFFDTAWDAVVAGHLLFPDHLFSVQQVGAEGVTLGYCHVDHIGS